VIETLSWRLFVGMCQFTILSDTSVVHLSASTAGTWHTGSMARGWESKGVESQIDAAEERAALAKLPKLTPEEAERNRQRESLQLSRKRVVHDIDLTQNPRYRATLEAALKHLDEKIAALS
jgi:hypothetical protein